MFMDMKIRKTTFFDIELSEAEKIDFFRKCKTIGF